MPDSITTILVVDSDQAHRESMARSLRSNAYRVFEAKGFQDAVNMYQSHAGEVDLLVTAIALPGGNGYQLSELLAATDPRIEVLFVSGVTGALLSRFYGRDPDNQATLFRPFEMGDLLLRVRTLIAGAAGNANAAGA